MFDFLRRHFGHVLIGIGILHTAMAISDSWSVVTRVAGDGFVNQVTEADEADYWFFVLGPAMIMLGLLAQWCVEQTGIVPRRFSIALIVTAVVCGLLVPANGIWSLGIMGVIGLAYAKPSQART